jgi:type I restriction enzyme M protein
MLFEIDDMKVVIMMNERITEDLVRTHFKKDPLFSVIKLEEQKSFSKKVVELLGSASKSGKGVGKPEFIVSFPTGNMNYLIVIECKASVAFHQSVDFLNNPKPKDFSVDGVLHYAANLSKGFDVIAVAVSGQNQQELQVSTFLWKKGETSPETLTADNRLLNINDYLRLFKNEHFSDNLKSIDIIKKAVYLNELYQAYSITETKRCTMVSAILLALLNDSFRQGYPLCGTASEIGEQILNAIKYVLKKNNVRNQENMINEYQTILNEPLFSNPTIKHKNHKDSESSNCVLKGMIEYLDANVYPLMNMEQNGFDVLGRFYTEFIRYAGTEQAQGLVLTPYHIAELFCELAHVNKESVIYDPCTGTGSFLIAGMKKMLQLAGNDATKQSQIKSNQLVGVELRPSMFTYACSNMMLRGDGKSNIYCDDCFNLQPTVQKQHKPTVAFLNPPYDVGTAGQMLFIEHALNMVAPQNGMVVAIVQMSCAIKNEKELIAVKTRLLEKHQLVAVLSMPDDLFYPVGVVTSVLVFQAHSPNKGRKTWFGYCKNDGFEKRKHRGRIDARGKWEALKQQWLQAYQDKDEVSGLSIKQEVVGADEWCAEAYMKTDYKQVTENKFASKLHDFLAFRVVHGVLSDD